MIIGLEEELEQMPTLFPVTNFEEYYTETVKSYLDTKNFDSCSFCANTNKIAQENAYYVLKDSFPKILPVIRSLMKKLDPFYVAAGCIYFKRVCMSHKTCKSIGVILANPIYLVACFHQSYKVFCDFPLDLNTMLKGYLYLNNKKALAKAEFTIFDMINGNYNILFEEIFEKK
jgi:hypothetical protein